MITAPKRTPPAAPPLYNATTPVVPAHYQSANGVQPLDVIQAFDLNFCLGNVVKYVCRAGRKDSSAEDLRKALDYLQREMRHRGIAP
jgi:hypothetical protein